MILVALLEECRGGAALRKSNKLEVVAANQMLKASRRLREIVSFCSFCELVCIFSEIVSCV